MSNSVVIQLKSKLAVCWLAGPSGSKASALKQKRGMLVILIAIFSLQLSAQQPLEAYLTEASENNPGLQAQYTAFEASLERAAQVSGLPNPSLSFGYFIHPVETRVGPQRARFSLSQMFPWFGSLSAKGDAAAAMAQAKYLQFIDAREKLISNVKASYYELWQIRETIELERENLRILESYEDLATTRVRSGDGKLSDVYRVQLEIEESQTRIDILENQLAQLKRNFNRLLNTEAEAAVELLDTMPAPENFLQLDSAARHPSVARLQQMEESTKYQITAARKSGLPSFGLGLDYVIVGERNDMSIPDNGKDVVMPMLSLSLPVWRNQYTAAQKEAEFQQRQYQLEAEDAVNRLNSQVDMSLFRLQQATDEMQLYREEISLANKTLELTITDYTNGREDFEEILRLQQKIIQYKKQKLKSYRNYLSETAELQYLTFKIQDNG